MKKRWWVLLTLAVAIVSLMFPAASVYVHRQLGEETATLFPQTVSIADIVFKGADSLPTDAVPALGVLQFNGIALIAGLILMALGAVAALTGGKGSGPVGISLSTLAVACLGAFALQVKNVCGSLLFTLLLSVKAWIYVPVAMAAVQVLLIALMMRGGRRLGWSDVNWRRLGGVLAIVAALLMLLPAHVITAPDTITDTPADAARISRTLSLLTEALGSEPNLSTIAREEGVFSQVLTGDLAALEPYSADGNNIRGVFMITTSTAGPNVMLLAGFALLVLCAVLAFIPKADRWFPLTFSTLAVIMIGASVIGVMSLSADDMFATASRQLGQLGLGVITPVPALTLVAALGAMLCGAMSVHYANEPYFVNPIPVRSRMRATALVLALAALVMAILPGATLSFYRPNQTRVQSTAAIGGPQALLFQTPDEALHPKTNRGADIYSDEAATGQYTASAVEEIVRGFSNSYSMMNWAAIVLIVAGAALLIARRSKKAVIAFLLGALLVRLVSWVTGSTQMPKDIALVSPTAFLYISLPLLTFSAFFANFADQEELPRKYKLFLMMLPFLLAVFLFSYLPLFGWSYAFYNYKFGLPMSQQEFVGFRWFTEMITNPGHRENIVRVLRNTFAMSGLNLATSWLPMVFAIFLNEISHTRFKKFVQIFTTLPNFISWALVFSFAMCLFSMETGIYTKFMMGIGAIDKPVAWLNSSSHIWLKMWAWNTWKGLGWGAIMYLAAIAGIDQELYEAARVDGAGRWMQMRYITLPGLLPTFFVLLMLSISNILNNGMEQYLVFQNSMNKTTIEVLDLYVYNITIAAKGDTLYSFATAIGILKTVVSVTLLFSANFASKKLRGESIV